MLFAVVDELMEEAARLVLLSQGTIAESGIEYLVGLGIVIVHGSGRLGGSGGTFLIASEEVEEVVVLGTIEFAFAQMGRVDEALLEKPLCFF